MVIIFCFLLIIVLAIYIIYDSKLIEKYTNQPISIILMGDSILDNSIYVEKSVGYYIEELISGSDDNLLCIAKDNSTIQNMIVEQLPQLNEDNNNQQTYIFVSVGGNDILQKIVYRNASQLSPDALNNIIANYEDCVMQLTTKMNKSNVILLTLYYPQSSYYRHFVPYLQEWNVHVKETSEKYNCSILDLSNFMTGTEDFSYDIEPSDIGGKKIADNIMKFV